MCIRDSETSTGLDAEIEVSEEGQVYQVTVGDTTLGAAELAAIDLTVEIDEELATNGRNTCANVSGFVFSTPTVEDADESDE